MAGRTLQQAEAELTEAKEEIERLKARLKEKENELRRLYGEATDRCFDRPG